MDKSNRVSGNLETNAEVGFKYIVEETGSLWVNSVGLTPPYTEIIKMSEDAISDAVATIDLLKLSFGPVEFVNWTSVDPAFNVNVERPAKPCGFT